MSQMQMGRAARVARRRYTVNPNTPDPMTKPIIKLPDQNEYGFNWKADCQPMLDQAKENLRQGVNNWIPVPQAVALYFLEVVPPAYHKGDAFACGEPYDSDDQGNEIHLCFRGLELTGIVEEPVNDMVCRLRATTGEAPARACYLTIQALRKELAAV